MKKIIYLITLTTFFVQGLIFVPTVAASAQYCKAGTIKFDSKYKYTCTKNNVWKKKLITTKKTNFVVPLIVKKVTKDTGPIVKVKTEKVENAFGIDNLDVLSVYKESRKNIDSIIEKSNYELSGVNFYIGPTINKTKLETEMLLLNRAAKLWSNIYKPAGNIDILLYDYNSLDWAKSTISFIGSNALLRSGNSCFVFYCGNATASKLNNGRWLIEQGLGGGQRNLSTLTHEYTHLAQATSDHQFWTNAPLWLVEGSAQFYGEALGYASVDVNKFIRAESHRGSAHDVNLETGKDIRSLLQKNNIDNTRTIMSMIEFPLPRYAPGNAPLAYLVGGYATEVLVAVYGHKSYEKFVLSFGESSDWQSNFKNSFGITKDDFYDKITPYLLSVSKEL
jgi:hypothetical protein